MKRNTLIAAVAGAALTLVPVAQAAAPDVVDRAVAAKLSQTPTYQGSPDAIERAVNARQYLPSFQGGPDAIDRARAPQELNFAPDAFERALVSHTNSRTEAIATPVVDAPTVSSGAFDWSDFGLGAGVGLGSAVLLAGLGFGALTLRRGQRVTIA